LGVKATALSIAAGSVEADRDPRLQALFTPRSVAIVGATDRPGSPFARPLKYLDQFGFAGEIYPVNPRYETIGGYTCYPSLRAIGQPVDLVVVQVPATAVEGVIDECAAVGASVAIVYSSDFAEIGDEGRERQERLVAAARRAGVRVVGPNCQGVIYAPTGLAATFTGGIVGGLGEPSGVAYIGQSGAIGGSFLDLASDRGFGLTAWVSVGNQADVDLFEAALGVVENEEVRAIAAYVESIENGSRFLALTRRCHELGKPLVLLRSGHTDVGRRAAVSHTGGLLAPGESFDAVVRASGAHTVSDVDDLLDLSCALMRSGGGHGPRVAIVTGSGGAGSMAADQLTLAGLTVPELGEQLQERLSEHVPTFGSTTNPIDVTFQAFAGETLGFMEVAKLLVDSDEVDQVLLVLTAVGGEQAARLARELVELVDRSPKPVHFVYLFGREHSAKARQILRDGQVVVYPSITRAVTVASAMTRTARDDVAAASLPIEVDDLPELLTEAETGRLLDLGGVPRPASSLISEPAHAAAAVARVGGLAVCKLQSSEILHKSDAGLVRLGVTEAAAAEVVAELLAAAGDVQCDGVLVQAQIPQGIELLVGLTRERPDLPPLLTVGLGGVITEALHDTVSECLPISSATAETMLESLRASALLHGFRGGPDYDVPAAAHAIAALARIAESLGERLLELEVNPLIVAPVGGGAMAVDGLLRLRARTSGRPDADAIDATP
jgi:acyl-CoA synthetase (NDP forming)